jgi:hypothetical protein
MSMEARSSQIYRTTNPGGKRWRARGNGRRETLASAPHEISGGNSGARWNFAPGAMPPLVEKRSLVPVGKGL